MYISKRPVANPKLVNPDCVPVQLDLRRTEQRANNVCTAQLAPARFVLLGATGSWISHTSHRDRVATPLWSLAAYILSLSFCQSLSPDLPLTFSHPRRRNPLLFYIARPVFVSFCCPFLLSRSLCLFTAYYIYMRFRAFHLCTPIVRTGKLQTRFAASAAEKGAKRVGRIRSNGARAER